MEQYRQEYETLKKNSEVFEEKAACTQKYDTRDWSWEEAQPGIYSGKKVFESNENLRKINLENLESGTYILSLQTESEKATFKIIKQ